ncbi:MAG: lysylphosphatidylglycerol synthase transmembrane domain-containing protein [Nanoarchaeota archaeon]|nr:lysylphosphatidylglycerol synthase transmembrane domain-containing protein [Nanoarchaeota archaeon]
MKLKIKKYLPLAGIAIFIYLLFKINILNVFSEIEKADLTLLFIAILLTFVYEIFQTLKWFLIARKQKISVSFLEAFKINFMTNFYGFVTPSKIGTIIRADYLKKYTKNIGKGISNFTIDKLLDLTSLFVLVVFFILVFRNKFNFIPLNYVFFFGFVLLTLFLVFYNKERSKFLLRIVYRKFVPKRMQEKAKLTFESFYEDLPTKKFLFLVFLVNLIDWIIIYLVNYFVGLSLGINLDLMYFLAILPIATLIAQIPITINGLGTREATMIYLFGLFGIEAAKVFSMSILVLLISGVLPSIIGSFLTFKNKDSSNGEAKHNNTGI